ncbi:MAG: T9SS type A sorting domain-containing protein [Muribaculaceae bacterium]|nr:T9SS type A sorting domain-containing protein [Muribaculaceae bacterium]
MKRILAVILTALGLLAYTPAYATADNPQWEPVAQRPVSHEQSLPTEQEGLEVVVRDGAVYITVNKPVRVEVFSILGQLITQKNIEEGTVRLTLRHKGIYILKAGSLTRRINL